MARVRKTPSGNPNCFQTRAGLTPIRHIINPAGHPIRTCLLMMAWAILVLMVHSKSVPPAAASDKTIGSQALLALKGNSPHSLVPASVRPLLTTPELETFLRELEGQPPTWDQLSAHDMTEQSERLFQFNRHRDEIREKHPALLEQPIAFVWSGELRHFHEEHQGYTIALGPEIILTAWGLVRFKPRDIPDNMIARIPTDGKDEILDKLGSLKTTEIGVLFIGTLTESESIMYAFSHDGDHDGMILPVITITALKYYLK